MNRLDIKSTAHDPRDCRECRPGFLVLQGHPIRIVRSEGWRKGSCFLNILCYWGGLSWCRRHPTFFLEGNFF
ncbi:UNVERIFIED_CONTAM: hypothetical protein NCL1_34515 [Trichonephila clavipes]